MNRTKIENYSEYSKIKDSIEAFGSIRQMSENLRATQSNQKTNTSLFC